MKLYNEFRRYLCQQYPQHRVSVRRRKIHSDELARCFPMDDGSFLIEIDSKHNEDMAVNLLIHEFAHVLAWDSPEDHGPLWGAAYAEVYNHWVDYLGYSEKATA